MLATRLSLTRKYASQDVPLADEWFLLDTAPASFSLSWLWGQWAEHRVPLAKAIWLGVLRLTDYDFRLGNFFLIFAWAAVAFGMILSAKVLRGHTSYSDAFFPLALLNFGQGFNFFWWWAVNQMLSPLVVCTVLLIIVLAGRDLQARSAISTATLLVLLSLCGPSGLPFVLGAAVWLGEWIYRRWPTSERHDKRISVVVLALVFLAVTIVGLYFKGLTLGGGGWPAPESLHAFVRTAVQLLSLSLGTAARDFWRVLGVGILVLTMVCMAVVGGGCVRKPDERCRALGLLLFMGAVSSVVLVIARARSGMNEDYIFFGTYVSLMAPVLCCAYFVSEIYLRPRMGPLIEVSLFTAAAVLLIGNLNNGIAQGQWVSSRSRAMEDELRAGIPAFVLAERHLAAEVYHVFPEDRVVEEADRLLGRLQKARIGVFARMRPDPELREVAIATVPTTTYRMAWKDGVGYGQAGGSGPPALVFSLARTRFVYAVRLKFSYADTASPAAMFAMSWGAREDDEGYDAASPSKGRHFDLRVLVDPTRRVLKRVEGEVRYEAVRRDNVVTIWVNDDIDHLRISPDTKPCVFRLSELLLLVPATNESSLPRS